MVVLLSLTIDDIVKLDPGGFFKLTVPANTSTESVVGMAQSWQDLWKNAGKPCPPLIILASDMDLLEMSAEDLRSVGLVRISGYTPQRHTG